MGRMKLVYFGYDFMLGAVRRLIGEGHGLAGIFTFPCDNVFSFNRETLALGEELGVPVILSAPQEGHIESLLGEGADCFLAAGYPFKIPDIPEERAYALNVHPSFLPRGRGLMPTPHILIHAPEAAGFTIHKLSASFDAGDIIFQEKFELSARETVDTYSARIAVKAPAALSEIIGALPEYWKAAKPQNEREASYFPAPDDRMRTLDWAMGIEEIARRARAFGRAGVLAPLPEGLVIVQNLDVWAESHEFAPGTVAARLSREIVVAAPDGFVCLKDPAFLEPV